MLGRCDYTFEELLNFAGTTLKNEDQHIDYKSGRLTEKESKQITHDLRQQVSGFGNADGGVLILGLSDELPRTPTGMNIPGGRTPIEWAQSVIGADMGAQFSPTIKYFVLQSSDSQHEILVIVIPRAPRLVPYIKNGKATYALRLGDATCDVPEFLLADLVLGRRNAPRLEVKSTGILLYRQDMTWESDNARTQYQTIQVNITLEVENQSFRHSVGGFIGSCAWSIGSELKLPGDYVQSFFAKEEPTFKSPYSHLPWQIQHETRSMDELPPFASTKVILKRPMYLPITFETIELKIPLYIVPSENNEPEWYELTCSANNPALTHLNVVGELRRTSSSELPTASAHMT